MGIELHVGQAGPAVASIDRPLLGDVDPKRFTDHAGCQRQPARSVASLEGPRRAQIQACVKRRGVDVVEMMP